VARTHLTPSERVSLETMLPFGLSLTAIAAQLGRSKSTVSRELRHHVGPTGRYTAVNAQRHYHTRREPCRPAQKLASSALRSVVENVIHSHFVQQGFSSAFEKSACPTMEARADSNPFVGGFGGSGGTRTCSPVRAGVPQVRSGLFRGLQEYGVLVVGIARRGLRSAVPEQLGHVNQVRPWRTPGLILTLQQFAQKNQETHRRKGFL